MTFLLLRCNAMSAFGGKADIPKADIGLILNSDFMHCR